MKWKGRRQSDMVEMQPSGDREKAEKLLKMDARAKANPRIVNEGEPIAYAEKSSIDKALGAVNNPGKKSAASKSNTIRDPAPMKLEKGGDLSRSQYDDLPFLEHTCKDCK